MPGRVVVGVGRAPSGDVLRRQRILRHREAVATDDDAGDGAGAPEPSADAGAEGAQPGAVAGADPRRARDRPPQTVPGGVVGVPCVGRTRRTTGR